MFRLSRLTLSAVVGAGAVLALTATPVQAHTHRSDGGVYVLSNQVNGNAVIAFDRAADGRLTAAGSFRTGGNGTAAGLGSQNAVVLDEGAQHLYAVNAGSDTISSFDVTQHGLRLNSVVPSGGDQPVSIAVRGGLLYVVNAGGDGNISGFAVHHGHLRPLSHSTRALSGTAGAPAQVSFTPDGKQLVVTEKATSLIVLYRLGRDGRAGLGAAVPSSGSTPFGFAFTREGRLAVSEAGPSAASTYEVRGNGLRTISASVPNTEAAACWLVVTDDGRYAYTGNGGGSMSISGYRVGRGSSVTLLTADGKTATAAGGVSDLALSRASRFLYTRLGDGTIGSYRVRPNGELAELTVTPGLPTGAAGIAAR